MHPWGAFRVQPHFVRSLARSVLRTPRLRVSLRDFNNKKGVICGHMCGHVREDNFDQITCTHRSKGAVISGQKISRRSGGSHVPMCSLPLHVLPCGCQAKDVKMSKSYVCQNRSWPKTYKWTVDTSTPHNQLSFTCSCMAHAC